MNYVEWCEKILTIFGKESREFPKTRAIGLYETTLEKLIWGDRSEEIKVTARNKGLRDIVFEVVFDLKKIGLIEDVSNPFFRLTRNGMIAAENIFALWEAVCHIELPPDVKTTLQIVNEISQVPKDKEDEEYAWTEYVSMNKILGQWTLKQNDITESEVTEKLRILKRQGMVFFKDGDYIEKVKSTYRGLAWEQRRAKVLGINQLRELVDRWETTSVDFKRELYLRSASEKAEFIKDVIGLANTQASGERWLIIGFDDKTRDLYIPTEEGRWYELIDQDTIERILSSYIKPNIEISYKLIDYKTDKVGMLEILRDPQKLPYRVVKSLGDKFTPEGKKNRKRIEEGQIFVRHGSHTALPDEEELQDLTDEAQRAKSLV